MTKLSLKLDKRTLSGRKVKSLRRDGIVPGNVFGKGVTSVSIQVPQKELQKIAEEAGETAIIYASIEGESDPRPLLISALQVHPVTSAPLHVDFHQVDLKEKVTAAVPIVLKGDSPAVADLGAVLVQQMDEIEVEALPTDLPSEFELDVTSLKQFDDSLKVSDLKFDKTKVELKAEPDEIIVIAQEPQAEEVVEVAPAEAVEGEVPTEGAPAKEGETPAPEQEKKEPKE